MLRYPVSGPYNRAFNGINRAARPLVMLLDVSGRKVMEPAPGANDVRRLSPGVYFCRQTAGSVSSVQASSVKRDASSATKVIVTR